MQNAHKNLKDTILENTTKDRSNYIAQLTPIRTVASIRKRNNLHSILRIGTWLINYVSKYLKPTKNINLCYQRFYFTQQSSRSRWRTKAIQ